MDIRGAAQPRYHLEIALLRWIHLRKLVAIEDLVAGAASGSPRAALATSRSAEPAVQPAARPAVPKFTPAAASASTSASAPKRPESPSPSQQKARSPLPAPPSLAVAPAAGLTGAPFKDALLAEVRRSKAVFYNMVVAQAQKIELVGDRMTFSFSSNQRTLRDTFEQNRTWLEGLAQQLSGRKVAVVCALADAASAPAASPGPAGPVDASAAPGNAGGALNVSDDQKNAQKKSALRDRAMADAGVQALLEVFPAEIRDVEEM
jgi:hypothetical protein